MRNSINFIGQEQDGTLLFHWHDVSPGNFEEEVLVSFVGAYNPHKQDVKTVFIHDQKVQIMNASINKEHTFLAFSTIEETEVTGPQGRAVKKDVYKAFIAEIQPQNRVFYLNLERDHYIKLQFLYGHYRSHKVVREAHLLVFLHKESIGLYHLPMARAGEDGFIMSGEPKKEQLFHRRFVWLQFDAAYQRLYVLYHRKGGRDVRGHTVYQPFFAAIQFIEGATKSHQTVLDSSVNLPVRYMKDSTKSTYLHLGPYHSIPDSSLNVEVLTNNQGALCMCFQHIPEGKVKTRSESDATMLQYSVYVLHKEKMLKIQCCAVHPDVVSKARICFTWMDGYLLAYLAGHFTHLLNVGVEFDVSLHIIYRGTLYLVVKSKLQEFSDKSKDVHEGGTATPQLVQFAGDKHLHSQSGVSLFDASTSQAVRLGIDQESLLRLFTECSYLPTRAAILHYATVQVKDLMLIKQLIEVLSQDPSGFDVVQLLQEYLTGSMYCSLSKQVERNWYRYLPYSAITSSANKGQVYCDKLERVCSLSYAHAGEVTFEESSLLADDTYWQLLLGHIQDRQWAINCRFDLKIVRQQASGVQSSMQLPTQAQQTEQENQSFFQRISSAAKNALTGSEVKAADDKTNFQRFPRIIRPPSRVDTILGKQPGFLKRDEEQFRNTRYFSKTVELLSVHLLNFLTTQSRTKIRNVAEECVKCQIQACRLLCHVVWSVLGSEEFEDRTLLEKGGDQEENLFRMYERVFMAAELLSFPLPSGFDSFFVRLGYRCQSGVEFTQCMERGLYKLSPHTVLRFLHELPDSEANTQFKFQLLHKLNKESALECLKHWQHPLAQQCVAERHSAQVLRQRPEPGTPEMPRRRSRARQPRPRPQDLSAVTDPAVFPPLQAFVKYLENRESVASKGESAGLTVNKELLTSAAMAFFK